MVTLNSLCDGCCIMGRMAVARVRAERRRLEVDIWCSEWWSSVGKVEETLITPAFNDRSSIDW